MNMKLFPVKLAFLIKDEFFNADIYLKIGQEFVKYVNKDEDNKNQLINLSTKACSDVYLDPKSAAEYMKFKKDILSKELFKETSNNDCLKQFHNNYDLLKDFFVGAGLDEEKAQYIKELGKQSIRVLEKNQIVSSIFNDFKKENPDQLVFKEFVSFLSLFSLKYFDKIPTDQLEKLNVAILLTDILLPADLIPSSYTKYAVGMPQYILDHPHDVLNKLPNETYFESSTIINILKNHHELPDGSGYPHRLSYTRFDVFLCTHFVAEQIVLKLVNKDLKLNEIADVYAEVYKENKRFSTPNFNRVFGNFDKLIKRMCS